jgi:Domain of unknown function (DUF397)
MVDLAYGGARLPRLHAAAWRKSKHSNPSGNCVEMTWLPAERVAVRDSRCPDGPALIFTHTEWEEFLRYVKMTDVKQAPSRKPASEEGSAKEGRL